MTNAPSGSHILGGVGVGWWGRRGREAIRPMMCELSDNRDPDVPRKFP